MAIMEVSVIPIGVGPSVSSYVTDCIRVLKKAKVSYELTAMGTNVEGNLNDLIRLALKMHQVPFSRGAQRVVTTIKIDDRRDKKISIAGKKRAVQRKLVRS
jgi:uncharacterized protein (TIGR00106 family)